MRLHNGSGKCICRQLDSFVHGSTTLGKPLRAGKCPQCSSVLPCRKLGPCYTTARSDAIVPNSRVILYMQRLNQAKGNNPYSSVLQVVRIECTGRLFSDECVHSTGELESAATVQLVLWLGQIAANASAWERMRGQTESATLPCDAQASARSRLADSPLKKAP